MVPELELPLWPVVLPELLAGGVVALDCPEVLPEAPLDEGEVVELLPLAPPMLLPCAPKCASHSERETWPSLFLSTSLKLGAEVEAPAAAEPLVVLDWLVVVPLDDGGRSHCVARAFAESGQARRDPRQCALPCAPPIFGSGRFSWSDWSGRDAGMPPGPC